MSLIYHVTCTDKHDFNVAADDADTLEAIMNTPDQIECPKCDAVGYEDADGPYIDLEPERGYVHGNVPGNLTARFRYVLVLEDRLRFFGGQWGDAGELYLPADMHLNLRLLS